MLDSLLLSQNLVYGTVNNRNEGLFIISELSITDYYYYVKLPTAAVPLLTLIQNTSHETSIIDSDEE